MVTPNPDFEPNPNPLAPDMEEWDEFVKTRYPEKDTAEAKKPFKAVDPNKKEEEFRNYEKEARASVKEFYRLNHWYQTYDFGQQQRKNFLRLDRKKMGIWEAMEFLNQLVDDSDPDTDLTQLDHLLQTAEQIRRDGHPRWFILTGLIHDLGKILCLFGEPQWAVVGDTFPLGCPFSDTIVFHPFFENNPDSQNPEFQKELGIYEPGCGLDKLQMSWGHDEYLYHVVKDYLPMEGLYMIRYHSFYPWHRENAYAAFVNDQDRAMLPWVRAFNPYDLYTKSHEPPNAKELRPYYEDLIREFFPEKIAW